MTAPRESRRCPECAGRLSVRETAYGLAREECDFVQISYSLEERGAETSIVSGPGEGR